MSRRRRDDEHAGSGARAIVAARYRRRLDRWNGTPLEGSDTGAMAMLDALDAGRAVEVNGCYLPADIRPGGISAGRYRIGADDTVTLIPWSKAPRLSG